MTWDEKVKMITHLNNNEYEEATQVFIDNVNKVDSQAIDMFITGIDLTKETLSKSIENHKIILTKLKEVKSDTFRKGLRLSLYEQLILELCDTD